MALLGKLVSLVSRRTLRSEGHVFAVTPERIAVAEGIHAALAMAPMLCAAVLLARPEVAFGAVAAFWNCLCDPQGAKDERLRSMGMFTALGAVVLPAAAYLAHWGYAASIVTLFVLVFLCGLTRSYKPALGPMPAQAGLIASLAVVIGVASPAPFGGALLQGGYFLLGSLWTMLFCIVLWQLPFRQSACLTLETIFARLDDMAGHLEMLDARPGMDADGWEAFDTVYRRGVRMSIERGRALAAHDPRTAPVLGPGIDAAGRVFSALIALGHSRRNPEVALHEDWRSLLQGLRQLLQSLGDLAEQEMPIADVPRAQAHALVRRTAGRNDQAARAVSFAAMAILRLAEHDHGLVRGAESGAESGAQSAAESASAPAPTSPSPSPPATFHIDALVWRHAVRVATAAVIAYLVCTWFNVTFAYWGAIAAIVVTQPISANTWLRVVERACGSFVGGILAAYLLTHLTTPLAMALAILPLAAITVSLRLVNYGLFVVFLTPMFMLLSDFIRPAEGLILARLTNEFVGACVGVAASFLLWPGRANNGLAAALSSTISANMAFAAAVARLAPSQAAKLDHLQREAGMASTRLETARERIMLEGRWRSAALDRLREVIVAARIICGAAAVIEVLRAGEPDARDRQRADAYDDAAGQMLKALEAPPAQASELPIFPAAEGSSADASTADLDHAVGNLVTAVDGYLRAAAPARTAIR